MTEKMDASKIKVTKTYSITLADVNNIKEMGEFLTAQEAKPVTDAEVLHRAIHGLYAEVFLASKE